MGTRTKQILVETPHTWTWQFLRGEFEFRDLKIEFVRESLALVVLKSWEEEVQWKFAKIEEIKLIVWFKWALGPRKGPKYPSKN